MFDIPKDVFSVHVYCSPGELCLAILDVKIVDGEGPVKRMESEDAIE
jgi:hypothetical protein